MKPLRALPILRVENTLSRWEGSKSRERPVCELPTAVRSQGDGSDSHGAVEVAGSGSLLDLFRIRADKICYKIRHGCEKRRVKNGVEAFGLNI